MKERSFKLTGHVFNLEELSKEAACLISYIPEDVLAICPNCDTETNPTSFAQACGKKGIVWIANCPGCGKNWRYRIFVEEVGNEISQDGLHNTEDVV